eukprot:403364959
MKNFNPILRVLNQQIIFDKSLVIKPEYVQYGGQNKLLLACLFEDQQKMYIIKQASTDKKQKYAAFLIKEGLILQKLQGINNIVGFYGILQNQSQLIFPKDNVNLQAKQEQDSTSVNLVLEFCSYGSLQQWSTFTIPFIESSIFVILRQILGALQEIHKRGIIHLDIKEGNILIAFEKQNQFDPLCANMPISFKIADLGIAVDLNEESIENLCLNSGTPKYMAPEQHFSKKGQIKDVFKLDVYSIGILIFHLVFKAYPFLQNSHIDSNVRDPNFIERFMKSERNTFKIIISSELKELLKSTLEYDQDKRICLNQISQSDWYKKQEHLLINDPINLMSTSSNSVEQKQQNLGKFVDISIRNEPQDSNFVDNMKNNQRMPKINYFDQNQNKRPKLNGQNEFQNCNQIRSLIDSDQFLAKNSNENMFLQRPQNEDFSSQLFSGFADSQQDPLDAMNRVYDISLGKRKSREYCGQVEFKVGNVCRFSQSHISTLNFGYQYFTKINKNSCIGENNDNKQYRENQNQNNQNIHLTNQRFSQASHIPDSELQLHNNAKHSKTNNSNFKNNKLNLELDALNQVEDRNGNISRELMSPLHRGGIQLAFSNTIISYS